MASAALAGAGQATLEVHLNGNEGLEVHPTAPLFTLLPHCDRDLALAPLAADTTGFFVPQQSSHNMILLHKLQHCLAVMKLCDNN